MIIKQEEEEEDGFVLFTIKTLNNCEQERFKPERVEQSKEEIIKQEIIKQEIIKQEIIKQERIEQERIEQERIEQERIEQERVEKERIEEREKERVKQVNNVLNVQRYKTISSTEKYTNIEYAINALLHTFFVSEYYLPDEIEDNKINDYYVYESIYSLHV